MAINLASYFNRVRNELDSSGNEYDESKGRKLMAYSGSEAASLIIKAGMELVKRGLIARTWGNISARLSDTEFLITPSGMAYDSLTPDKLVVCKIADCSYSGEIKPSSEKGVHGEAYKYRKDVNFVVHTHQPYATAIGSAGEAVRGRNKEECELLGREVPVAKYAISSTKALKKKVSKCIQKNLDCNAFFMRYHGVLTLGRDYGNAFEIAETLEDICKEIICEKEKIDTQTKRGFPSDLCENEIKEAIQKKYGYTEVLFDASPIVCLASEHNKCLKPIIDDMAQIAGASYTCVNKTDANMAHEIANGLGKNAVVFVRDLGAVCCAFSKEEADAISMVLEKNCLAAVYCAKKGNNRHLKTWDAKLQRNVYVKKYSKLK